MKLSLEKSKEQYKLSFVKNDGKKEKFDYIRFINLLFNGEDLDDVQYDKKITEDEKNQINKMIEEIRNIVKEK